MDARFRILLDGRVLHVYRRIYNSLLTISVSADSPTYDDGW